METLEKRYETIRTREQRGVLFLQLYRPEANNSINAILIQEMMMALLEVEVNPEIKVVVLEGLPDNFCTGLDFKAFSTTDSSTIKNDDPNEYYELLKHFSLCSKIIVSVVEGKVNAGGVGIVAASDIVIADTKATFSLSEVMFGLLPACVMPFLIRRIGYQKAAWMTLTTQSISADRSYQLGLVDEVSENIKDVLRINLLRLTRLEPATIKDLKDYMSKLWIVNDSTQKLAVDKITSLLQSEKVQYNIKNFIENKKLPWNK